MLGKKEKRDRNPVIRIANTIPGGKRRVVTVPIDELDVEYFGMKYPLGKKKVRIGKPVVSLHVDGFTILLEGEKRVNEFLKGVGKGAGVKVQKLPSEKKGVQPDVYYWRLEFQSADPEDVFNRYKRFVKKGGVEYVNLEFYTGETSTAELRSAVSMKRNDLDVGDVKDLLVKSVPNTFVDKNRVVLMADLVRMPKSDKNVPISCGYKFEEVDGAVNLTPYILVGGKEYEYETRKVYPTSGWKRDTAIEILKDAEFIADVTKQLLINSRVRTNIDEDKDFVLIEEGLKNAIEGSRIKIPKRVANEMLESFKNGATNICSSGQFSTSELCLDVAILDAYQKIGILPSLFDEGLRGAIVKFVSGSRRIEKKVKR